MGRATLRHLPPPSFVATKGNFFSFSFLPLSEEKGKPRQQHPAAAFAHKGLADWWLKQEEKPSMDGYLRRRETRKEEEVAILFGQSPTE